MKRILFLLIAGSGLLMTMSLAEPLGNDDIEVKVKITGENVVVDLNLVVSATPQEVWAVLTDFEHMASYISNLKQSNVIAASGNIQKIFQKGTASYGLITFPFESIREIQLTPFDKIQSHMISGNMRKLDGTTQLLAEGGRTRIIFHSDNIPGTWIPPIIGKTFIAHESRQQFQEIRNEILKRKTASGSLNN